MRRIVTGVTDYVVRRTDGDEDHELGVYSADSVRAAAEEAARQVKELGWRSWELVPQSDRSYVVAWSSATEDDVVLMVNE